MTGLCKASLILLAPLGALIGLTSKGSLWVPKRMNFRKSSRGRGVHFQSKHRKNCECCPRHSLLKGHNVTVNIVVPNCQKCSQCLKCQVSCYKSLRLLFEGVLQMSLSLSLSLSLYFWLTRQLTCE